MGFLKKNFIFLIVFITGAIVLIIEVTATRILAPYFGNTLYSVSSILGVILGALSFGYYIGGILADKYPKFSLFFFLIFVAGIFSLLIQVFREFLLPFIGYNFGIKFGPLIISLILFFVPNLILGTISPFAIKLKTLELKEVGKISGKVFFWSTVGSIFGSFLAGFFLIPHFGTSKIIVGSGILLCLIGFFGIVFLKDFKKIKFLIFPFVFVLFFSFLTFCLQKPPSIIFQKDGVYAQITIEETKFKGKKARILRFHNHLEGAVFLDSDDLPFEYTKYYVLYKIINPNAQKALFLGGGAYSIPRKILLEKNEIKKVDVAEIEPYLFQLAKEYFRLPEDKRLFNFISDGRRFLKETKEKYDLIFVDAYSSLYSIPVHMTTKEFFSLAKDRLSENGVILMNVIGKTEGKGNLLLLSIFKTFNSVFKNSYLFAVESPKGKGTQNFIILGLKDDSKKINFKSKEILENEDEIIRNLPEKIVKPEELNLNSAFILSDDFSPIEYLVAELF